MRITFVALPFQKARIPSSRTTRAKACGRLLYAFPPSIPLVSTDCTWNRSFTRSKGADAVRAITPAPPPAMAILLPS